MPVLENLRPVLHNLDPFLQYTGEYVPEVQAFFANLTAASQASETNSNVEGGTKGPKEHLLTTMPVLSPESLAVYPSRIGTDRCNPYPQPGTYNSLAARAAVFSTSSCANSAPAVSGPANETISRKLIEQIIRTSSVANKPETANKVACAACIQQGPFTLQRPDQPVPARRLRWASDEPTTTSSTTPRTSTSRATPRPATGRSAAPTCTSASAACPSSTG